MQDDFSKKMQSHVKMTAWEARVRGLGGGGGGGIPFCYPQPFSFSSSLVMESGKAARGMGRRQLNI